ncbi:MotA/TolQ/ExbB proton channel family protein [Nannocystaceae bacterium ST9]
MDTLLLLANEAPSFTLSGMWAQMGIFAKLVLIILVLQFIITAIMGIERFIVYSRAKKQSIRYIMMLRNFLNERKLEEAVAAVKQNPDSPIAKVVGSGMDEYLQGMEALQEEGPEDVGDFDIVDAVNRQMERTKERETANLKKGLALIATTGSTAPFVGLLGTVVGIINSFQGLAGDGGGGLSSVAGGISEALIATAVGLLVAIPAVMVYNYFNSRVEGFQIDMNDVASEVINFVLKEGRY